MRQPGHSARYTTYDTSGLLALVRAGDPDAFGELFVRYQSFAYKVARSSSRREADDLVAEAFRRVYTALSRGHGPSEAFGPYLATTIRSAAAGLAGPYQTVEFGERHDMSDDKPDVDPRVTTAYLSLPESWQNALWYSDVEGLSPRQAAPMLGLPSANAFSALRARARAGLRSAYLLDIVNDHVCNDEVREQLAALIDGDTTPEALDRVVDDHLDECDRCSAVATRVATVTGGRSGMVLAAAMVSFHGFAASSSLMPAPVGIAGLVTRAQNNASNAASAAASNAAATAAAAAAVLALVVGGALFAKVNSDSTDATPAANAVVAEVADAAGGGGAGGNGGSGGSGAGESPDEPAAKEPPPAGDAPNDTTTTTAPIVTAPLPVDPNTSALALATASPATTTTATTVAPARSATATTVVRRVVTTAAPVTTVLAASPATTTPVTTTPATTTPAITTATTTTPTTTSTTTSTPTTTSSTSTAPTTSPTTTSTTPTTSTTTSTTTTSTTTTSSTTTTTTTPPSSTSTTTTTVPGGTTTTTTTTVPPLVDDMKFAVAHAGGVLHVSVAVQNLSGQGGTVSFSKSVVSPKASAMKCTVDVCALPAGNDVIGTTSFVTFIVPAGGTTVTLTTPTTTSAFRIDF